MNKIFYIFIFILIIPACTKYNYKSSSSYNKGYTQLTPLKENDTVCLQSLSSEFLKRQEISVIDHIKPSYLKYGDSIGVIAISSKLDTIVDTLMIKRFESWGLNVAIGKHLYDQDGGWFAGNDINRSSDFQYMLSNDNIKAIIFYRGGYGSIRVLDNVDLTLLKSKPKWIVGFSDITAIHYAINKLGVESIHAAMPSTFNYDEDKRGNVDIDPSAESLKDALFGETKTYNINPHVLNQKGEATGKLVGGNLSLICSVAGTDIDNQFEEPSILLIEEISEPIHHIDRMLQNLKRSGKLSKVKGIIVGYMTDIRFADRFEKSIDELIYEYVSPLNIPVVFGFPAGHEHPNIALYMNSNITLKVTDNGALLQFNNNY